MLRLDRVAPVTPVRQLRLVRRVRGGRFRQEATATSTQQALVLLQGQHKRPVFAVPFGFACRNRANQSAVFVVVLYDFFRFPAREASEGDAEPDRRLDVAPEFCAMREAFKEKGMLTSA